MSTIWKYLKPHRKLIFFAVLLAGAAQLLSLVDPVIFGKIIDDYASNPRGLPENRLLSGVLYWLGVAVIVALFSKLCKVWAI